MKIKLPHICFFGCGVIAARHAKLLKKLYPKIEISFASRSISKAKAYTSAYKGSIGFGNYQEAAESDLFDIAFITTPPSSHYELAMLNANNRKDIIVEKPVARNLKELSGLEKAVSKNNVRFTVAENYLYKSFLKRIRLYIRKGYIGSPLFIELNKTNRDTMV
ncbi:MAG: Gfo/Idh/MocA family oxidoreductase [Spirochaetota bacterium]|nr:Gfo/Idh/MocA family oxidoreductase [Spirochaetota bacterium]